MDATSDEHWKRHIFLLTRDLVQTVIHLHNLTSVCTFPIEWIPSLKKISRHGRFNMDNNGCVRGADATTTVMVEVVLNSTILNACAIDSNQ